MLFHISFPYRKDEAMSETLKQKILEFVALAKECPEPLQVKCFELLLSDYLAHKAGPGEKVKKSSENTESSAEKPAGEARKKEGEQEDILESDIHVKARQFLKRTSLSIEHINQLFYMQDKEFLPLYDDLKTTKTSESQLRIALLQALLNGMRKGDFEFNGEAVREEAQMRKCYDQANFAKNFKNNAVLFDTFTAYDKTNPVIKLSPDGKEKLAEIIKDLQ
jgi:hypothetical protein